MSRDDDVVTRVAEAVSDGIPVDWAQAKRANPDLSRTLDRLEVVEAIMNLCKEPPAAAPASVTVDRPSAQRPAAAAATRGEPIGRWGPLAILERIGEGGFGEVYRAFDPSLEREVALKLWKAGDGGTETDARDFLEEARSLARVRHPHVLEVHGADRHDGRVGMWTDLLEGRTLEECLEQQGPFGAHEAATIGMDLCRALAAMHAVGLVHRDVKTHNVMREHGGRIVLMDFGCAAALPGRGERAASTALRGTPLTMAPEQLRGETAGPATDIYGLGVILYRLVTGSYPIEAESFHELIEKHGAGAAISLRDRRPNLPPGFVHVVDKALDPDPANRYVSAGAMERALAASIGTVTPPPRPSYVVPRPRPRRFGRLPWLSIVVAHAAAPLICGLILVVLLGAAPRSGPVTAAPKLLFAIPATLLLFASLLWTRWKLRPMIDAATDPARNGPFPPPERFSRASIVSIALAEMASVLGLVPFLLSRATLSDYVPFGVGTMAVILFDVLPLGLRYWSAWEIENTAARAPDPTGKTR